MSSSPPPHVVRLRPELGAEPAMTDISLDERPDDDLVLLARAGREEAFNVLVRRHQKSVLQLCHKFLLDPGAGHDAAQNTFVELFRCLPRYTPRGRFPVYLRQIALNQCRILFRSRKIRERHWENVGQQPLDDVTLPDEALVARERRRELDRALLSLSEKLRVVLVLRYSADLSIEQIAETLELPVGTVKSRLFAGVERLRLTMLEAP